MAKDVRAKVIGGNEKVFDNVDTVADVMSQMNLEGNYSIKVNGEPAESDESLNDYEFITFAKSHKGGR